MNSQRSKTVDELRSRGLPFTADQKIDKSKILISTRLVDNSRSVIIFEVNGGPTVQADSDEEIEALIDDSDIFIPEAVKAPVRKT